MICFTRYVKKRLIKMLSIHYHKLIGKIKKHEGKKYLMVDNYTLNKALDKIKEIRRFEKFEDATLLILLIHMINSQKILLWKMLWY